MMSSVFSKNREKRSRSSSSESNSFVKNMTSRVSGLLPATITKWFSSPTSSANGSAATAEGSDSSTEEEGADSPAAQPPPKRMRYLPETFDSFTTTEEAPPSSLEPADMKSSALYETIQTSTYRKDAAYGNAQYISAEDISSIEVVKMPPKEREFKAPIAMTPASPSIGSKRKSIFESTDVFKDLPKPLGEASTSKASTSTSGAKEYKPSFKPSLFGSPFYPGRTMYGGASSSTYINHPNVKRHKVPNVRESIKDSEMVNMSSTARRVMDLLENYSSPLMEAKRIRGANSTAMSDSIASANTSHGYSYKTQELHVPSLASIMRVKQRARLMNTTKAARQLIASHSSTSSTPYGINTPKSDPEKTTKLNTKMKTRLTRLDRGEDLLQVPEPVQMPKALLQIDENNLPKFSLSGVTSISQSAASKPTYDSYSSWGAASQPTNTSMSHPIFSFSPMNAQSTPKMDSKKLETRPIHSAMTSTPKMSSQVKESSQFKFSSPVTVDTNSHESTVVGPKFTFGSPERKVDVNPKSETKPLISNPLPIFNSSSGWKCSECWIMNKEEADKCASCTTKRQRKDGAGLPKPKCSMCKLADSQSDTDKCVNCEKVQMSKSIALPIPMPADPTKWKCGDCWVSNDGNVDKCACCGSRNPSKAAAAPLAPKPATNHTDSSWKCENCWIRNESNIDKCVACAGVRPGSDTASPAPLPSFNSTFARPPDDTFSELAKAQKDKWECPSCLVRNESNKSLCVCCGMERSAPTKLPSKPTFSFGKASNTTFKFGIDPKVQESNLDNKKDVVSKKEPSRKLEELETNNNTVSKIPTFSFGMKPETKSDSEKPAEVPKMTFNFGLPKQNIKQISVPPAISITPATPPSKAQATTPIMSNTPSSIPDAPPSISITPVRAPTVMITTATPPSAPASLPTFSANMFVSTDVLTVPAPVKSPPYSSQRPATVPTFGTKLSFPIVTEEKAQEVPKVDINTPAQPAVQSFAGYFAAPKTTQETPKPFSSLIPNTPIQEKKEPAPFTFGANGGTNSGISNFPLNSAGINSVGMFGSQEVSGATTSSVTFGAVPIVPVTTVAPTLMFSKPESQPPVNMFQVSEPPAPASTMFNANANTLAVPAATPLLGFGANTTQISNADKPKFNFSFGGNTAPSTEPFNSFKPVFGQTESVPSVGTFGAINSLGAGSTASDNSMGGTEPAPMFGAPAPAQTENLWGANNNSNNSGNLFGNASQKAAPFTFGAPNPFNGQPQQTAPGQGVAASQAGVFGAPTQPAAGMFGNSSMFLSVPPAQPAPSLFGSAQPQQPAGMFGVTSQPMGSFDVPQSQPRPAFNFGSPPPSNSHVFGFGAQSGASVQPQQPQPQPAGVYNFGSGMGMGGQPMGGQPMGGQPMGMASPAMGVTFNMGSAPVTNGRRMRKALRRNPQR